MKILLVGPRPPPHGGIAVHVEGLHRQLVAAGMTCTVLDMSKVRPGFGFGWVLLLHSIQGWTVHFHTNGHNVKSWLLALGCGLASRLHGGGLLTLHSGMTPDYLTSASLSRKRLAALTCRLYREVICVNPEIENAVVTLGLSPQRTHVLPAFLGPERSDALREAGLQSWIERHRPLFSTILFFRPEYGFDLLTTVLVRLIGRYPSLGCLVMGGGEQLVEARGRVLDSRLEDNVLLLGDVKHENCLSLLSRCDVFLRPTLADGDSISVREALSLGIPTVASNVGTRPEGTILFEAGGVDEMLASIELALAVERRGGLPSPGSMPRLLEIYRNVDGSKGIACIN